MPKAQILIVEDDAFQRRLIKENLVSEGYTVFDAADLQGALDVIREYPVDLAVIDYQLEKETGIEVISALLEQNPLVTPVMVTAYGSIDIAVDAIKKGAYDYITKPIDFEKFLLVMERALERQRLRKEVAQLRSTLEERYRSKNLVFTSSKMDEVAVLINKAAKSDATVLISGETGTGKEVVAKSVHFSSRRKDGAYIAVNIPSLPETLIESELFGAEKGSFTGAHERKLGKFEAASGGTLFLDEIGDLPHQLQVKLLRFLQDKEFYRLGSNQAMKADVRIIAATNKDLEKMMRDQEFRQDLYYRLNVIHIHVPELRERREDIPPLVDAFIRKYSAREGKSVSGITADAMNLLLRYSYPGNVRELENIIERALVFCEEEEITTRDLPLFLKEPEDEPPPAEEASLPDKVKHIEMREIRRALRESGGVKSRAARRLGLTERILSYKMKTYRLDRDKPA